MLALIEQDKSARGIYITQTRICGVRALFAVIGAGEKTRARRAARLCEKCAVELYARGADAVCFHEGFELQGYFSECGLREATARPLFEREAARIARLASPKGETAAFFAERIMRTETETIKSLARDFRYVLLFTGACPAAIVRDMGERMGASLIGEPSAAMIESADAAVFFAPPARETRLPDKCVAVSPNGSPEGVSCAQYVSKVLYHVPALVEAALPAGYPREVLMAAAVCANPFEAESVRAEEVIIASLRS